MNKKWLIVSLIILMFFSVANNYYANLYLSSYHNYYLKQLLWYVLGFIVILILSKVNIDFLINNSFYFYLAGNFLLLITLFWGVNVNGSKSWLSFKFISFQPSEFMKIFLILYLYKIIINKSLSDFKYFLYTTIIFLIPSVLTFLEPDTGPIIFYLIIYVVFLFLRKLNKYYYITLFLIVFLGFASFFYLYFNRQDLFISIFGTSFFYRLDRITNFMNNKGYQITQALTSISNSGYTGIKEVVYFPEAPTDFAFTLFLANFGLMGVCALLIIYTIFFYNLLNISKAKYLLYPVLCILIIQYTINILMNLGLFPIIGITLPFLSYGGSSLLSYMFLIGLLLNKKSIRDTYL